MKTLVKWMVAVAVITVLFCCASALADNLTWTVSKDVLTISGTGDMDDYSMNSAPWQDECESRYGHVYSVIISDGVTSIGSYAFSGCTLLTSITIPDSVTHVGEEAFTNCRAIRYAGSETAAAKALSRAGYSFRAPGSQYNIRYLYTGEERTGLSVDTVDISVTSFTFPEGTKDIGDYAFSNCQILTDLEIPEAVTSIGTGAFQSCKSLTEIVIPEGVERIGNNTFYGCNNLVSITIPESLKSIGAGAFTDCWNMTNIHIASVESWAGILFENKESFPTNYFSPAHHNPTRLYIEDSELTEIVIPENMTSIGNYAFYKCSNIASFTFPQRITSIGKYAFYGCSGLTEIMIQEDLESIGEYAFQGCTNLREITVPESLASIGQNAFYGCSSLTELLLPDDVTSVYSNAFPSAIRLYATVGSNTAKALSSQNLFFHVLNNENVKLKYTFSNGEAERLDAYADQTDMSVVEIPTGVTNIAENGFNGCTNLTRVSLPVSLRTIYDNAFSDCSALELVTIPASVTSIGTGAFPQSHEKLIVTDGSAAMTWAMDNGYPLDTNAGTGSYCYSPMITIGITEDNFPDSYFRSYVRRFDFDGNGSLSVEERNAVTDIELYDREDWDDQSTPSLVGVEHFPMLEELTCMYCLLKSLDLSQNTHLKYLDCSYNPLRYLNLSNNTELEYLDCHLCELSSLNVSHMPDLYRLDCGTNRLVSLTVGTKKSLMYLDCQENRLTSLDVSRATHIDRLNCSRNKLTSLNLGQSTMLQYLTADENKLPALDITNTPNLTFLACNLNDFPTLDISHCPALESIMVPEYLSYNPKRGYFIYYKGSGADNWFSCDTDVDITIAGLPKYAAPQITMQSTYIYPSIVTFTVESATTETGEVRIVTKDDPWIYGDDWYEAKPLPATFRAGGEYPIYLNPGRYMVRTLQVGEGHMDTFSYFDFEVVNPFTFSPEKPNNQEPFDLILDKTYDRAEVQVYQQGNEEPYLDEPIVVHSTDRVEMSLSVTGWYTIKVTCEKNGVQTGPIENLVEIIQWRPTPDLILPEDLVSIEEEAFQGIKNVVILMPESVQYIAENAFDPSVTVMADWGSYAYDRCEELGIEVYENDY